MHRLPLFSPWSQRYTRKKCISEYIFHTVRLLRISPPRLCRRIARSSHAKCRKVSVTPGTNLVLPRPALLSPGGCRSASIGHCCLCRSRPLGCVGRSGLTLAAVSRVWVKGAVFAGGRQSLVISQHGVPCAAGVGAASSGDRSPGGGTLQQEESK